MFSTIDLFIASTFVCVVMALVLWMQLKPGDKLDKQDSQLRNQRIAALLLQAGDWANAAVKVVIGVLLGASISGVAQLILTGAWFAVFNIGVLSVVLFLIVVLHERLGEILFPSGIRPARKPKPARKVPLARRLSLPAGLVLGVFLASLGLSDWLSGWLL